MAKKQANNLTGSAKKIAVMTSGGDAQGMNAAVRGVVRAALNNGWEVYGIRDAFLGLVRGEDYLFPLDWMDVGWNFREGGTFLGSARYTDIIGDSPYARQLKEKALQNLNKQGITALVVIGGDGSLTGAYELFSCLQTLRSGHPELSHAALCIVGIPGSIDNDIACTDMSIGVDTTLNTIVECIDKLRDTATSHKRISIVEVMGRLRGYLAVMSGLASGADRIFIRETKTSQSDLNEMLTLLRKSFVHGQKAGIIVRSEGATFSTGFLKEIVDVLLDPRREVRETVLGHLQRGGSPTAFERTLATRMGVRAVRLIEEGAEEPSMVGLCENEIRPAPLKQALDIICEPAFKEGLSNNATSAYHLSHLLEEPPTDNHKGPRIAVLTDGNNVSGMNMAIRAVARIAMNAGAEVKGIKGGFSGLLQGPESMLGIDWSMLEMKGVLRRAGTLLGVSNNHFRLDGKDFLTIRKQVERLNIQGVVTIGNNTAYRHAQDLSRITQLPIVGIPADTNCNLPGTNWVIGMDSALEAMQKGIDMAADAAHVQKKICIVQLKGSYCRCLVHLAALAGGAEQLIFHDETIDAAAFNSLVSQKTLQLKNIISLGKSFATLIVYSTMPEMGDSAVEAVQRRIRQNGIQLETIVIPLETSYGGTVPTAFDRTLAMRLGSRALSTLNDMISTRSSGFSIVGISGKGIVANAYKDKVNDCDRVCPPAFVAELEQCLRLMNLPGADCAGLGGDIEWIDTPEAGPWKGAWTCKKCRRKKTFTFDPTKMQCVFCDADTCHNYGFIRISRRL